MLMLTMPPTASTTVTTASTGDRPRPNAVAAARIADALTQDVLLAPLEAGVLRYRTSFTF
jgi:hypothetical protein